MSGWLVGWRTRASRLVDLSLNHRYGLTNRAPEIWRDDASRILKI
jgi:hypothetical protein